MAVLFVHFKRRFRKVINGHGECCECCGQPFNYQIEGSGYERLPHKCRRPGRVIIHVDDDDENDPDDEEMLEGARIERGFAMMEMRDELEYASL
jgi:transposase